MRTRLRRIVALTMVSVFAAVVAGSPTALADGRKNHKQERDRKHWDNGKSSRLYRELKAQIDQLSKQLAALRQAPSSSELAALKATVDSMNADLATLKGSVGTMSTQWSADMSGLKTDVAGVKTSVGTLSTAVTTLQNDLTALAGYVKTLEGLGGTASQPMPALIDGNEQKVGNVVGLDQTGSVTGTSPWVAFNEGGHFFALKVTSDQRGATASQRLAGAIVRFAGAGCTGQAYLDPDDGDGFTPPPLGPFSLALAGVNDNDGAGPVLIYVAAAKTSPVTVKTQSMIDADGFCAFSGNGAFSGLLTPALTLQSNFVPPYKVEVR